MRAGAEVTTAGRAGAGVTVVYDSREQGRDSPEHSGIPAQPAVIPGRRPGVERPTGAGMLQSTLEQPGLQPGL